MDDLTLKAMKDFAEINKTLPRLSDIPKIYDGFANLKAIVPDKGISQMLIKNIVPTQELLSSLGATHVALSNLAITPSAISMQKVLVDPLIQMLPDYSVIGKILADFSVAQQAVPKLVVPDFIDSLKAISLSHITLANLSWENIGGAINANDRLRTDIYGKFLNFSNSYLGLYQSLDQPVFNAGSIPSHILALPPTEFFNGTDLLEAISNSDEEDQYIAAKQDLRSKLSSQVRDELESLLADLDKHLVSLWQGVVQSLNSSNADRSRHFLISLRELFTQVLHRLAPDREVRAWSSAPEHFHNGEPTRQARLLFICRGINDDPFNSFVKKDVSSMVSFWDIFNRVHQFEILITQRQLEAFKIRVEGALRFLLEIWKSGR